MMASIVTSLTATMASFLIQPNFFIDKLSNWKRSQKSRKTPRRWISSIISITLGV